MDNHNLATVFQSIQAESPPLDNLTNQRFHIISAIVVLLILMSGLAVGTRWWALNLYP